MKLTSLFFLIYAVLFIVGCAPTMKDFQKLQTISSTGDEEERIKAAKKMGTIKDADPAIMIPVLSNLLKSDISYKVRIQAAHSLKELGFLESKKILLQSLTSDMISDVRSASAESLCVLFDLSVQQEMIQCAQKDQAGVVRASCVKCLGTMESDEVKQILKIRLQNDGNSLVRKVAVQALGNMKDASNLDILTHAVENDQSLDVKKAAVISIGAIPGKQTINYLVKYMKIPSLMDSVITAVNEHNRGYESYEFTNILVPYIEKTPSAMDSRISNIFLQNSSPGTTQAFRKYFSLETASNDIIQNTVVKMRKKGNFSLLPYLIKDLGDSNNFHVQVNLIHAIAYFRDRSAAPVLLNMLRNRSCYHSCLPKHLIWALAGGGLNDPRAYDYLCRMCCNEPDKKSRRDACEGSSDIYLNNYKVKLSKCPCWNK